MFSQSSYLDSDAYEKEKLGILQTLNFQLSEMAVKLDRIVTHAEQTYFGITPQHPQQKYQLDHEDKSMTGGDEAAVEAKKPVRSTDTTAKRNKQQRQFNTFVRESINQLLGPDYMRTHDVQDIDHQVMEMIRKEAIEHYLPDNIRPRRAWHLAKASLRTLKRTLNNKHAELNPTS